MGLRFENLADLNQSFTGYVRALAGDMAGRSFKLTSGDPRLQAIQQIFQNNASLINHGSLEELTTILHSIKTLESLGKRDQSISFALESSVNMENYLDTIAQRVAEKKANLLNLGLNEQEILELVPRLSYIKLEDSRARPLKSEYLEKLIGKIDPEKVKTLKIRCANFNHRLPSFKNLKKLTIKSCPLFNQSLPSMDSLESLSIKECPKFNKPIPPMKTLTYLLLDYCTEFNQPIGEMQALETLCLNYCTQFNQPLPIMNALKTLALPLCYAYNQPFPELKSLKKLNLVNCQAFNQPLPISPLEELNIASCIAFSLIDQPLHTTFLLSHLCMTDFVGLWLKLPRDKRQSFISNHFTNPTNSEELQKIIFQHKELLTLLVFLGIRSETFLQHYPQAKHPLTLAKINALLLNYKPVAIIQDAIASIRRGNDYMDYLQTLHHYPRLVEFMIRHYPEDVRTYLEQVGLSIMSLDNQTLFFPLLEADRIAEFIQTQPEIEKKNLLEEIFIFSDGYKTVETYLTELLWERDISENSETIEFEIKEFLKRISLKCIANYAAKHREIVVSCIPLLDSVEMGVVIPQIGEIPFMTTVKKCGVAMHPTLLSYATTGQKKYYLSQNNLALSLTESWQKKKQQCEEILKSFASTSSIKEFQILDSLPSYHQILAQYQKIHQQLMTRCRDGPALDASLNIHNEFFQTAITSTQAELKEMTEKIEQTLNANPMEIIPDEYMDCITSQPMTNPYTDRHGNTLDKSTWDQFELNPFTREAITDSGIQRNPKLQSKIDRHKRSHPKLWS